MGAKSSHPAAKVQGPFTAGHMATFADSTGLLQDGGAPGGGGSVTNTGTLTADQLILGNGGVDIKSLGSAGTSTTVLHGGAPPTYGAVSLTADVTGDLPFSNLAPASAASKLLGRGDSGAGDYQEITLGTNLSMSGTTLNATGGSSLTIATVAARVIHGI